MLQENVTKDCPVRVVEDVAMLSNLRVGRWLQGFRDIPESIETQLSV